MTNTLIDGLHAVLSPAAVTTPSGADVLDLIGRTAAGQAHEQDNVQTPTGRLISLLERWEHGRDADEIRELVDRIGAQATWDALTGHPSAALLVARVYLDGALTVDDTIFDLGADHPGLLSHVLGFVLNGSHQVSTRRAVEHAVAQGDWRNALFWARKCGPMDEHCVDLLADCLVDRLDEAATVARDRFLCTIEGDQTERLLQRGRPADVVLALLAGFAETSRVLHCPPAVAILAHESDWVPGLDDAIARQIDDVVRWVGAGAASRILQRVPVPDAALMTLLRHDSAAVWFAGARQKNRPLHYQVLDALQAGIMTVGDVFHGLPFTKLDDAEIDDILAQVPGLSPALLDLIARAADGYRPDEDTHRIQRCLRAVAAVLDDDVDLWQRFLTAGDRSPFRNPDLTVREAADVYRDRWAEARRRRG